MKTKLVDYLACLECKASLNFTAFEVDNDLPWPEILEGRLTCEACHQEYPISKGVPRLLPTAQLADEVRNTVEGFGYE